MNHNTNKELPPKTCSIERLITNPEDIEKIIKGKKTATRRNGRYADVGELMIVKDKKFIIERVYPQYLGDLTDEHAHQEGFDSIEQYKNAILSFHPGMPWLPKMRVWVHEFRAVNE